jgi:hypothetical protein
MNTADQEEKDERSHDFIEVLIYTLRFFTGNRLREFQQCYFEGKTFLSSSPNLCCSSCQIKIYIPFKAYDKLLLMVQT